MRCGIEIGEIGSREWQKRNITEKINGEEFSVPLLKASCEAFFSSSTL